LARDAIVFAMANPIPEVMPEEVGSHARIMATGRADYPNQINNVCCFPGFLPGHARRRARTVNDEMKIAAAEAIAAIVSRSEAERGIHHAVGLRPPRRGIGRRGGGGLGPRHRRRPPQAEGDRQVAAFTAGPGSVSWGARGALPGRSVEGHPVAREAWDAERAVRRPLSQRFQDLIDAVAHARGRLGERGVPGGMGRRPERERPGGAEPVAEAVAVELEALFGEYVDRYLGSR